MPARILIQLDPDAHASTFDSIVALDSGVDHLLVHHAVEPTEVRELVHGAMFTRAPGDLKHTAIFIGGSNVETGALLLQQTRDCFFGPMRVSVMLDASGANTTAAAAVLCAARHLPLAESDVLVLAATGPVGQRAVQLLARAGAAVRVASRRLERAERVCAAVREKVPGARLRPVVTGVPREAADALAGAAAVISAGAAGAQTLAADVRQKEGALRVAIDLNAVPPAGIEGVEATDRAKEREGTICYGAIGVGGLKMKIHKAAVQQLFDANDQVLDAEEIFAIGQTLEHGRGG
jgi:hypothetical protein